MLHAPADAAARIHSGDSFTRLMSIHLVNPSHVSFGIGVITPRWLYVLAAATPESYGEPLIVDETLEEMGIEPPDTLYGLYRGVELAHRDSTYGNVLPDVITIYQGPIEEDCADEAEMAELVRDTVVHELGHYFGLDDETMERIEDSEP